jgi:outer membrane protein insertion porin family
LGTFIDAGALNDDLSIDHMKYSAGISGEWLSPFGALSVSAAYPINAGTFHYTGPAGFIQSGEDQTQYFQFNFGQNF